MLSGNYILQIYSYLYFLAHGMHLMMVCEKAKPIYNVNSVALEMNMAKVLKKDNQA